MTLFVDLSGEGGNPIQSTSETGAIATLSVEIYPAIAAFMESYRLSQKRTPGIITTGFFETSIMMVQ